MKGQCQNQVQTRYYGTITCDWPAHHNRSHSTKRINYQGALILIRWWDYRFGRLLRTQT